MDLMLTSSEYEHCINVYTLFRPNKKNKCVSGNRSEKFRQAHTFFNLFFFRMKFQMHEIIYFSESLKKIIGFISKLR